MYDRKHTYSIIANINMLIQLTHFINVVDYNYCMAKLRSKSESLWACIQMIYCILHACFFNKHTNIDSNFQRDRIIKPQIILPFLIFPSCKLGYLYYHRHHITSYPPEQVPLQFGGSKNLSIFFFLLEKEWRAVSSTWDAGEMQTGWADCFWHLI